MEKQKILSKLKEIVPEDNIKIEEPMKNHTSFKIGGLAEFFVKAQNKDELKKILKLCKSENIQLTIVGNGSNILVTENGIKGIVLKLDFKDIKIEEINEKEKNIIVGAGVTLGLLSQKLLKEEIAGFEELSGIPGTIGGAIIMNAGAHGKEIKDIVTEVIAMDYEGNIHIFTNEESKFEYRQSRFSTENYIILQAKIFLQKGNKKEIKEKMDEYAQYRKEKQPIELPSAGSTFKRGEDYITAKLIDEAGLKGYSIGGAKVSEKHAGFIVNTGNATSEEVLNLVQYVKDKVYEKFKKKIELEIKVL